MKTDNDITPWELKRKPSRIEVRTDAMHSYAFSLDDEVNARLIAAAPELLDQLEKAAPIICSISCPSVWQSDTEQPHGEQCRELRAAIAKARGEV